MVFPASLSRAESCVDLKQDAKESPPCATGLDASLAVENSEAFAQAILNSVPAEIAVLSNDGQILAVNASWQQFARDNGVEAGRMPPGTGVGANYLKACPEADEPLAPGAVDVRQGIQAVIERQVSVFSMEYPCHSPDTQRWFAMTVTPLAEHGRGRVVVSHTDITRRKLAELAQQERELELAQAQHIAHVGSWFWNAQTDENTVSQELCSIYGRAHIPNFAEQRGTMYPEATWQQLNTAVQASLQTGIGYDLEIQALRGDGALIWINTRCTPVCDAQGNVIGLRGTVQDITERRATAAKLKAHQAELDRIAHYDPLTGTPNRRLLADRLSQAMLRSTRSNLSLAVCFLDLDGFKRINDRYGHAAGDRLLVGVTANLENVLRAEDTLARLGGDEFVLLLSDISSAKECTSILDRVVSAVRTPVDIGNVTISISASIGVSMYPDDNGNADALLRHADQAMYLAKQGGKNRYCLFDPSTDHHAQIQQSQLDALRHALEHREFVLYYQPIVDLASGAVVSAEALIRWLHPKNGLMLPAEFLPQIRGSDLETSLGAWVIQSALNQAVLWRRSGLVVGISINIAAHHLLQPGFYDELRRVLANQPELPASCVVLEIIESTGSDNMDLAIAIVNECRKLGVRFALDDFGTGRSSLTHLRQLPIDTLKIDESIVQGILKNTGDLGMVEGVVRWGKAMNQQIIAEGVETPLHGAALLRVGCHLAQGYGIAHPMPAAHFQEWAWKHNAAWRER